MAKHASAKLNNGQRKAIAAVKDAELHAMLKRARAALERSKAEIIAAAKHETGVNQLLEELEMMREREQDIERVLTEKGWRRYNNGTVLAGSKIHRMVEERLSSFREDIKKIADAKLRIIQEVWTAQTEEDLPEVPKFDYDWVEAEDEA